MSSSAASSAYWRAAGLTYNKYATLCADLTRAVLKPDAKAKAKLQEAIYYRSAKWENGTPGKQVITDIAESAVGK